MAAKSSAPTETDPRIELPEMSGSRDVETRMHRGGNNNYPQHGNELMEEQETAFRGDGDSNINVSSTQAILGPNNNPGARKGILYKILKEILMFLSIPPGIVVYGFLGIWAGMIFLSCLQWNILANDRFRWKAFRGVDAMILTIRGLPRRKMKKTSRRSGFCGWVWGSNLILKLVFIPLSFLHYFLLYPIFAIVMTVYTLGTGAIFGCLGGIYLGGVVPSRFISDWIDATKSTDTHGQILEKALVDCKVLSIREHPRRKGSSIRQVEGSLLFYFLMALSGLSAQYVISYMYDMYVFYILHTTYYNTTYYKLHTTYYWHFFHLTQLLQAFLCLYFLCTVVASYETTVEELRQEFIEHAKHLDEEEATHALEELRQEFIEHAKHLDEEETTQEPIRYE